MKINRGPSLVSPFIFLAVNIAVSNFAIAESIGDMISIHLKANTRLVEFFSLTNLALSDPVVSSNKYKANGIEFTKINTLRATLDMGDIGQITWFDDRRASHGAKTVDSIDQKVCESFANRVKEILGRDVPGAQWHVTKNNQEGSILVFLQFISIDSVRFFTGLQVTIDSLDVKVITLSNMVAKPPAEHSKRISIDSMKQKARASLEEKGFEGVAFDKCKLAIENIPIEKNAFGSSKIGTYVYYVSGTCAQPNGILSASKKFRFDALTNASNGEFLRGPSVYESSE